MNINVKTPIFRWQKNCDFLRRCRRRSMRMNPRMARFHSSVRSTLSVSQLHSFSDGRSRSTIVPHQQPLRGLATKRQNRASAAKGKEAVPNFSTVERKLLLPSTSILERSPPLVDSNNNPISGSIRFPEKDDHSSSSFLSSSSLSGISSHPEMFDPSIHLASAPTDWKGYEPATPLWNEIAALIGVTGKPITVADYMAMCLTHPEHGYYTKATGKVKTSPLNDDFDHDEWQNESPPSSEDPTSSIIGPRGDFVTAPEISQIFGECLAVWFMTLHQTQHNYPSFAWVECGPGNGSLMIDLLRFTFHAKIRHTTFGQACKVVHLVESSPALRKLQQKNLEKELNEIVDLEFYEQDTTGNEANDTTSSSFLPRVRVYWHDSFLSFQLWQNKTNDNLPLYMIGQEFVDALPVHVFEKTAADGWRERLIDIVVREDLLEEEERPANNAFFAEGKKPRLRMVLAPEVTPAAVTLLGVEKETGTIPNDSAPVGSVVEVCPEGILFVQDIAKMLKKSGGAALLVDYGSGEGTHDSVRGFSNHEQVPFLCQPGEIDITADVDFAALKEAVNRNEELLSIRAWGPVRQGDFLMSMGAQDRVIQLMESPQTTDEQAEDLYQALVRLAAPEEMGERFKVMGLVPSGGAEEESSPPPGFHS